jgi:hypothetical protein
VLAELWSVILKRGDQTESLKLSGENDIEKYFNEIVWEAVD